MLTEFPGRWNTIWRALIIPQRYCKLPDSATLTTKLPMTVDCMLPSTEEVAVMMLLVAILDGIYVSSLFWNLF